MPNRIIKESICASDTIDKLSWFEEVFFYRLMVNVDDYGRFDARTAILKARLFPLKSSVTEKQIEQAIEKLNESGILISYTVYGKPYLQLPTWEKHQTVRNHKSKYPSTDEMDDEPAESNCNQLKSIASKCSRNPIQSVSNPDPDTDGKQQPQSTRFKAPCADEVKAYCAERKNHVDADKFIDYYTANGWKVGKNPMKDWKAAIRTWEKNSVSSGKKVSFQNYDQGEEQIYTGPDLLKEAREARG